MGLTEEFVVLRAPCTIPFRKDEGVPPPLSVFHGEYSPHSLLIAEANWTQEKSEDKVPMQSRGTLVTPVKDPNGMGLVWEGFLVAYGSELPALERASREVEVSAGLGAREQDTPGQNGVHRAEPVGPQEPSRFFDKEGIHEAGVGLQPPREGLNLPKALHGSSHPTWAEASGIPLHATAS